MNSENDKTKNNLESSVESSIKMMDEYIESIKQTDYPQDLKQDIINLFANAREELLNISSLDYVKTEEE
tara:strand:- start:276 stop:482 length:207 start_codon:yes stop_codon:yes gene_type:complete